MKKNLLKWLTPLMLIFFIVGCQASNDSSKPKEEKKVETKTELKNYKVKDDRGKEITFKEVPKKLISLAPSNTEILFALGTGDKIVGATDNDNYPEKAKKIERVSAMMKYDTEKMIALKPDVVIAHTFVDQNAIKQLEDAGLKVFVINSATSFKDVYSDIEQIAMVMGVKEKGDQLVKEIKDKIASVEGKVKDAKEKPAVYFEISPRPEIYTAGSDTFQQEIMNAAGIDNVFKDQKGWVKISEEEVIKRNPKVITTTVNYGDDPIKEIPTRKGWDQIAAVKDKKVFYLDADVMSRPGPRIGEAVELIAKTVYPDLFK